MVAEQVAQFFDDPLLVASRLSLTITPMLLPRIGEHCTVIASGRLQALQTCDSRGKDGNLHQAGLFLPDHSIGLMHIESLHKTAFIRHGAGKPGTLPVLPQATWFARTKP
ncbi:MAG: hypothetical protein V4521_03475 [Pseudomonadota bacterium]